MPTKEELEAEIEHLKGQLRETRSTVRDLKGSKAEHKSKSERTTITVEIEDDGRAQVLIDRDGMRIQQIDMEKEPISKAGLGN